MLELVERDDRPEKFRQSRTWNFTRASDRPTEQRRAILDVLDTKRVRAAGPGIVQQAGELSGESFADGRPIDREDCIIAATAIREKEPVLTQNTDHFDRIAGLDVESY